MNDYPRFFKKVVINPTTQCWEWTGCKDKRGYGRFLVEKKNQLAHKFAYEYHKGPAQNYILHTCDTPHCVNPDHLVDEKNKGRERKFSTLDIIRLKSSGLSTSQIAQELECDPTLVRLRLRENQQP